MIRNKGFSLTELMVALSILGLLISIATPQVLRYQAQAKRTEAYHLLRAIRLAELNYFLQFDTYTTYSTIDPVLENYFIHDPTQQKHYQTRFVLIEPSYEKFGFFAFVQGQLDPDPTEDVVSYRHGNPGPVFDGIPLGQSILMNDVVQ